MEVTFILLGISIILFLGFFAEFLFKKFDVPDILILISTGFILGPYLLNYVHPIQISTIAPLFTTFALLFLSYDGAFNISLESLAKGAIKSLKIMIINFTLSVTIITLIMLAFQYNVWISLLTGFLLGGICSVFTASILDKLDVDGETYSILTLEAALTDVFSIVFAFTIIEIMTINTLNFQVVFSTIASLFAVAGLIGIIAGIVWIILVMHIFREHKSYMITIAYLLLIYFLTEYLNGNGAIAALFFGLMLKNSKDITTSFSKLLYKGDDEKKQKELRDKYIIDVTSVEEKFFYSQISFLLKTFFFVYIGILIDLSDIRALMIGLIIAVFIYVVRTLNRHWTLDLIEFDKKLVMGIYGRGLASAAIAQVLVAMNIPYAKEILNIVLSTILFTILFSSISIGILKHTSSKKSKEDKKDDKKKSPSSS
ncbi:MAG TPA: cation:proton antiporter [Allocoleopsis sp.]